MQTLDPINFPIPFLKTNGWKVILPNNRRLATPAIKDGRVFLGGGFGSHEFYAFDAETGKCLWQYHTHDDGPTAAIVEEDLVLFNTESCELEVLDLEGKSVWKKWLGDPLMSMPAAGNGRVFIAFPDSRGDRRHCLGCFHLRNGNELWRQPLTGDVITAPVLADNEVYLTTLDGTLYSFNQEDGKPIFQKARDATSSPSVWNQQCFYSRRQKAVRERFQTESLSMSDTTLFNVSLDFEGTRSQADYLDYAKRKDTVSEAKLGGQDTLVGFASFKGDAKMEQAKANLGQGTVAGVWSYQGSRPFFYQNRLYMCMGPFIQCFDPLTEKVIWRQKVSKRGQDLLDQVVTPPAVVNGKVFVGSAYGFVACLTADSGRVLWRIDIKEPVQFQPAVAKGRVYVSTSLGTLYCLETGDPQDDGWFMWGGTAGHNGVTIAENNLMERPQGIEISG